MPALPITEAAIERYNAIVERVRERARVAGVPLADVDDFLSVHRRDLLAKIAEKMAVEAQAPIDVPEEWTPTRRTERNLAAMKLLANKAPLAMTADDRIVLAAYSGWGGLSLEKVKDQFPPSLEIDTEALIHEYYTPFGLCLEIARVIQPLLSEIAGVDGIVRALEPSAGIGRFIRAFDALPSKPPIRWTAVELSNLAASLLAAVRPGTEVEPSSFEAWVAQNGIRKYNLVIANPPFGERGVHAFEDPNREYRETNAAAYFPRRSLDALTVGGLGIFILPAGYLSDARRKKWREKILLRHHLVAAYRLPSHVRTPDGRLRPLFPGTQNVTDVLFFRRRPGELEEVDAADEAIAAGDYFTEIPGHVLGTVDQSAGQYKVIGPPVRLPAILPRPICESCRIRIVEPPPPEADVHEVVENAKLDAARALGGRISRYLDAVAQRSNQAVSLWPELHASLLDWARQFGSPFGAANLRELAGEKEFLRAWDVEGRLMKSLQTPPSVDLGKLAALSDPVALAEYLWAQERGLTVARLMAVLSDQGQEPNRQGVLERLYLAGWCVDGPGLQLLMPRSAYLSGNLWRRIENLDAAPEHARAAVQRELLREHIPPVLLGDLGDYSPRLGWIPPELIERFAVEVLSASTMRLTRKQGFIGPESIDYETIEPGDKDSPLTAEAIAFLGWLNHDLSVFRPKRKEGRSLLEEREERSQRWETGFRDWIASDPNRTQAVVSAYVRKFKGYRKPTYSTDPINLVRWTDEPKAQLYDYQRGGVRRIVENRGGILSYDVGVGKTFTALAAIALLRQEGTVKRPIIVVPNSLIFQWLAEIKRVLPDYRVGLIGSKLVVRKRGVRKNQAVSVNDSGLERASKWARFQGGEYDLVLVTYSALARTRLDIDAAADMFDSFGAVAREIRISRRAANRKDPDKLTEREEAIKDSKTAGWIQGKLEIPKNWEYDGDVVWDKLGCDFLVVDEFHNFKNLFMPDSRERGLPAFMGSGGEGSDRAWQLFFRAASVRRFTGGGGILGLTATPAKNGPTELFSAFSIIDPAIWTGFGISDAEQFIDQFCLLEPRPVVTTSMTIEVRDAMVGFQNLADLRSILERYIEFKSAREAAEGGKLKKPKAKAESVPLEQDEEQRRKLAEMMAKLRERVQIQLGNPPDDDDEPKSGLVEKTAAPDLGMIARLGLIAIHAQLDEGYTLDSAVEGGKGKDNKQLPAPRSFTSPKFNAVAERIVADAQCGHIVFLEPLAAQAWLREVLVQRGVPRERIALLNAETAKGASDRLKIATEFNEGKYLVIIANSVAGEGANLQRRTCAVHNVDIPWDPMTRRQRIGRADRQGNELANVTIYDYLVRNSGDGPRFHKLMGKGTWIEMIIQTRDDVSINPAAQISMSPIELLADLTNDPEESKRLLAEIEKKDDLRKKLLVRARIARVLRAVNDRYRTAERTQEPELAAQLRADGARMLEDMEQFDPKVWPFLDLARRVVHEAIVVTESGLPLWTGLRLDNGEQAWEVGRVDGGYAGLRQRGAYSWIKSSGAELTAKKLPLYEPADYTRPWRADADGTDLSDRIGYLSMDSFLDFKWSWASESFIREHWPRYEPLIREQFRRRGGRMIPAKSREGELYLADNRAVASLVILPPGSEGWQDYIRLGPATDYTAKDLADVASVWWDRVYPRRRPVATAARNTVQGDPVSKSPPAQSDPALAELLSEFDQTEAEGLLPLYRKRRAVRESVGILLRQRGVQVSTTKGMQGAVTASIGSKRITLRAKQLLTAESPDSADSEAEETALEAVSDILSMVERERVTHQDAAFDVVLGNLEKNPNFYDEEIKATRPEPEPEPEPAPPAPTPTRPIIPPRAEASSNYRVHHVYHSKHGKMVYVVELLGERVSEVEFAGLRDLARAHEGYYSRYKSAGVPRGFMFKTEVRAKGFVAAASARAAAAAAAAAAAPATPATTAAPSTESRAEARRGHAYQVSGRWYGDTPLIEALGSSGFRVDHIGMGDFMAASASGNINIDRYSDEEKVPEQVGRLHQLRHSAGDTALESVLATLVYSDKIALLGPYDEWPSAIRPGSAVLDETIRLLSADYKVQTLRGGNTSRILALSLARPEDGWPEGLAVARLIIHSDRDPEIDQWDLPAGAFREHGKSVFDQQNLKRSILERVKAAGRSAMGSPEPNEKGM